MTVHVSVTIYGGKGRCPTVVCKTVESVWKQAPLLEALSRHRKVGGAYAGQGERLSAPGVGAPYFGQTPPCPGWFGRTTLPTGRRGSRILPIYSEPVLDVSFQYKWGLGRGVANSIEHVARQELDDEPDHGS